MNNKTKPRITSVKSGDLFRYKNAIDDTLTYMHIDAVGQHVTMTRRSYHGGAIAKEITVEAKYGSVVYELQLHKARRLGVER